MIEIVFSESACGSLKAAQHYGEGKYQDGCVVKTRDLTYWDLMKS
jgi:hypothetical protein